MSDEKRAKRCETCDFWREWSGSEESDEAGVCARYAPRPALAQRFREDSVPEPYERGARPGLRSTSEYSDGPHGDYEPAWPIVWAEEWCGEWAEKGR